MDQKVYEPLHAPHCSTVCSTCNLREICLPVGLSKHEMEYIDARLVTTRRKVARGERLFQAGDPFTAVYAVWTGFFKTVIFSKDGREQVTGFQMPGELIGLDGFGSHRHEVDAVALEDSLVCVIRAHELEALAREISSFQQQVHRVMSREIVRNQGVMLMLGSMYADERVAAFILNLIHRQRARGYSSAAVVLRMSREEIGSFLGLKLETVSRTFSKFQANGLLFVRHRHMQVTDPVGLKELIDA